MDIKRRLVAGRPSVNEDAMDESTGNNSIPAWILVVAIIGGLMLLTFAFSTFYFWRVERVRKDFDKKPRYHMIVLQALLMAIGITPVQIVLNRLGWRQDHCNGLCGPKCMRDKLIIEDDEDRARKRREKEIVAAQKEGFHGSSDESGVVR